MTLSLEVRGFGVFNNLCSTGIRYSPAGRAGPVDREGRGSNLLLSSSSGVGQGRTNEILDTGVMQGLG